MKVRRLAASEHAAAVRLLAEAFADDAGMLTVVRRRERLVPWFGATLALLASPPGLPLGAFEGAVLRGVLLRSHSNGPGPGRQLRWLLRTMMTAGTGSVWRTIAHDRRRVAGIAAGGAHIVEFVATDPLQRGQGIGRALFEASHADGGEHWLETTRSQNLPIFSRLGYRETSHRDEAGVTYHVMQRHEDRQ